MVYVIHNHNKKKAHLTNDTNFVSHNPHINGVIVGECLLLTKQKAPYIFQGREFFLMR